MRWIATEKFIHEVQNIQGEIRRIAVVGGSQHDLEVDFLMRTYPSVEIDFFGVENPGDVAFKYLDLNEPYSCGESYDLVQCAHVLEHIWDVKQGIMNLMSLVRPGGLVWINCPASSQAHGSPHYFSAGYQPKLISNLAESAGALVLSSGQFGSRRSYFYEHAIFRWPSQKELENPLLNMTDGRGGKIRALLRWIKYLPQRVIAAFYSSEISHDPKFATQTFVALTKKR